jgi:hypothetical protein
MRFDELAAAAAKILATSGYARLDSEPGWCWESKMNRVRFGAPTGAHRLFPYVVTREHFDVAPDGTRTLQLRNSPRNLAADATPERVAKAIADKLENPS